MNDGPTKIRPVIGIDFDNTLVTYDELIYLVALERGLVYSGVDKSKKHIRDSIRNLPGGETEWQKLQAVVYGPRILEARPAPGTESFLQNCARHDVKVYIVSHKTEFANYDETKTNLRSVALSWMKRHRFFDRSGSGVSRNDVYFESSRQAKLDRIRQLGCTHFIDDLEETFLEENFPANVEKILYAPHPCDNVLPGIEVAANWREITDYFFHAKD